MSARFYVGTVTGWKVNAGPGQTGSKTKPSTTFTVHDRARCCHVVQSFPQGLFRRYTHSEEARQRRAEELAAELNAEYGW